MLCAKKLLFVLFCICFTMSVHAKISLKAQSVSGSEINLVLADSAQASDGPFVIAVSSIEGAQALVLASKVSGFCRVRITTSGYVQSANKTFIVVDSVRFLNNSFSVSINVSFNQQVYTARLPAQVTIHNLTVDVPTIPIMKKTAVAQVPQPSFFRGLRMEVDVDGIYSLTGEQLLHYGIPIQKIPIEQYKLFVNNKECPLFCGAKNTSALRNSDTLLFYGKALRGTKSYWSSFSNTNVYWLTFDNGRGVRVALEDVTPKIDPNRYGAASLGALAAKPFFDTLHCEYDNDIRWLGSVGTVAEMTTSSDSMPFTDAWYWEILGEKQISTIPFTVLSPASGGTARLRVALMGLTAIPSINPDHSMQILINNEPVEGTDKSIFFDGQTQRTYTSPPFSTDLLTNGSNTVSFIVPRLGYADQSALNYIEIFYDRTFTATNDQLLFHNNPADTFSLRQFSLDGFTSPSLELWDLDKMRSLRGFSVKKVVVANKQLYTLVFQDSIQKGTHYLAQAVSRRLTPITLQLDTIRDVSDISPLAQHLIVTSRNFVPVCKTLAQFHTSANLPSVVIAIEDIYNWYSAGITDPDALRLFVANRCSKSGQAMPQYLLLAGDATHDLYKNNIRKKQTIVPTHLSMVPGWGVASNDGYFGTVVGNDVFPDLCVGRFPAADTNQLRIMINKTIAACTSKDYSPWRDNLLLLGGYEPPFTKFNNETTTYTVATAMNVLRLDADPLSTFYSGPQMATTQCAAALNAGVYLVNFNGHGGGNVWSDNNFFGISDVARLYNDRWGSGPRLPIVFSFTCLTGFFESVFYPSLGEEFLRKSNAGAVAFLGASAYTSREGNLLMNKILLQNAAFSKATTLGKLINECKITMLALDDPRYIPLISQYNLLGDPALLFKTLPESLLVTTSCTSDSITVNVAPISFDAHTKATRIIADNRIVFEQRENLNSRVVAPQSITVKDSLSITNGESRVYAWNDTLGYKGVAAFAYNASMVTSADIVPAKPTVKDSIRVRCTASLSLRSIMQCLYTVGSTGGATVNFTQAAEVPMVQIDSIHWESATKILPALSTSANPLLCISFRVAGIAPTNRMFQFPMTGIPDLRYTRFLPKVVVNGDSLACRGEMINTGFTSASKCLVVAYLDSHVVSRWERTHPLLPGESVVFTLNLPDKQGVNVIRIVLNADSLVPDRFLDDNIAYCTLSVAIKDIQKETDTLFSEDRRCALTSSGALGQASRLFVLDASQDTLSPLQTPSTFINLNAHGARSYTFWSRPASSSFWNVTMVPSSNAPPISKELLKRGVAVLDTTNSLWRVFPSVSPDSFYAHVKVPVTTSAVAYADILPPSIEVSVGGRKLTFFDYAAKDKPFDVILSDASALDPASIHFFLNGSKLDSSRISGMSMSNNGQMIRMTLAPQKQSSIDSLSITAKDRAGNDTTRSFRYLPGENLSIKFLSCHPNPIKASVANGTIRVRFAYVITDVATNVTLSIYTQTGQKIRAFDAGGQIGYQEIFWNGTTEHGYRIANGLYYAKLTVSQGSKIISKIIRIAKLEGY